MHHKKYKTKNKIKNERSLRTVEGEHCELKMDPIH